MMTECVLVGGPDAGRVVAFDGRSPFVVVAEKSVTESFVADDPITTDILKTHRYDIVELVRGVFVGKHESLWSGSVDSVVKELLAAYVEHHKPHPPPDRTEFVEGFALARELMSLLVERRISAVSEN